MDDKQLEERIDLLKSSYERVPSNFDVDEVLNKIEEKEVSLKMEPIKKESKWRLLSVLTVSIASIFVMGLLSAFYIFQSEVQQGENRGDKQAQIVAEQYIEKLKEQYPIEREKRRKLLNLSEDEFSKIDFISLADSNYEFIIDPRSNRYFSNIVIGDVDSRVTDLLNELILPSEMVEEIEKQEQLDKAETIEFFKKYYSSINSLKLYANEKLKDYNDELTVYNEDGLYSLNSILENEEDLPVELQNLIQSLQKQGLELGAIEDGLEIEFRFNQDLVQSKIAYKLDTIADGYFAIMSFEPFTYAWELLHPMQETMGALLSMEDVLLDESVGGFGRMETYYTSVFYFLVKGTRENPVFSAKGIVKEEYRKMWRQMTEVDKNSPSPYLLIPIVKEFEGNGWKKSEEWDDFSYEDIEVALHLAVNGDLGQFMPTK
ncbi:hypothetical protein PB01_13715 [Psychrobacillus glaciei]|uniref:Uncharacterized protein n=1 Tax=Psychrobacillus glaciei TaxID=2283160 RepID=A0A5J6SQK0_9BACI|nr:hypothetical protein [Psychrobacillus glaciei]QFF99793.1 hypothetical protein PB01_13715 [Psychrobacillus glaciei]